MEVFSLTLDQMLMLFSLILFGYFLRKKQIVPDDTFKVLSKMETFVFVPALNLYNQMTNCTVKTFSENSVLILYGLGCILAAVLIAYPISKLFVKNYKDSPENAYKRNIYKYAVTFGNYGYVGNFIVLGIWGESAFFQYTMFTLMLSIACSSWGLYILIPKDQNAGALRNLIKGFSTPPMIAMLLGILIGLFGLKRFVPEFMLSALSNASSCMGPVAMLLAGVVIGGFDFKSLLDNKKVYIVSLLRLTVIPAVLVLALKLIGASDTIQTYALIAFASPLGLNTIIYPAAYGSETKTGASMAMISSTLSVITIPLMYLVFIVLL